MAGVHEQYLPGGAATTSAATTIAVGAGENPITGPAVGGAVVVGVGVIAVIAAAVKVGDLVEKLTKTKPKQTKPRTTVWRSVDAVDLGSIEATRQYLPGPGAVGKYFYPTAEQAHAIQTLGGWHGTMPLTVTSGQIPTEALSRVPLVNIGGEGPAWFIPDWLLPAISSVQVWGPA